MQLQRSKKGKQVEVRSHGGQYLRNTCKFFGDDGDGESICSHHHQY